MYATQQILSGKKEVYAEKGDELTVTNSGHPPVMICRDAKGNLFPVHENNLSENKPINQ